MKNNTDAYANMYSFTPKGAGEISRVAAYRSAALVASGLGAAVVRSAVPTGMFNQCRHAAVRYMDQFARHEADPPRPARMVLQTADAIGAYFSKAMYDPDLPLGESLRLHALPASEGGAEPLIRQREGFSARLIVAGAFSLVGVVGPDSQRVELPLDSGDMVVTAPASEFATNSLWKLGHAPLIESAASNMCMSLYHSGPDTAADYLTQY